MNKLLIYVGITIGGIIGSYIPVVLLHSDSFGLISIICGVIGSIVGLYAGYKIQQSLEL